MFDKKAYVKDKILGKLGRMDEYQSSSQGDNTIALIDKMDNLDMIAFQGDTFEESTIGWVAFCNTVMQLISEGKEVNFSNFKESFKFEKAKAATISRPEAAIDESLLIEEDPEVKMKRLLSLSETEDIIDDIEIEELTEEGYRSAGLIGSDQTELDAEDLVINPKNNMPIIRVKMDDPIISPFTQSEDICRVSENVFMDVETEELFRVVFV